MLSSDKRNDPHRQEMGCACGGARLPRVIRQRNEERQKARRKLKEPNQLYFEDLVGPSEPQAQPDEPAAGRESSHEQRDTELSRLSRDFNLSGLLRSDVLESRSPQCAAARRYLTSTGNMLLWARPNAGKTFVLLLCAIPTLSRGNRVYIITPQVSLTHQGAADAKKILCNDFHSGIVSISGDTCSTADKRSEVYSAAAHRLFFCTPEVFLNDLLAGRIRLTSADMLCLDEVHLLTQGKGTELKNAYYRIVRELKTRKVEPRILACSATPKDKEDIMTLIGATYFQAMERQGRMPPNSVVRVPLEGDRPLAYGKQALERAAFLEIQVIVQRLLACGNRFSAASAPGEDLAEARRLFAEMLKLRHPSGKFMLPYEKMLKDQAQPLLERLIRNKEFSEEERRTLGAVQSGRAALQSLRHQYAALSTTSKYCYLDFVARWIIAVNVPAPAALAQEEIERLTRRKKRASVLPNLQHAAERAFLRILFPNKRQSGKDSTRSFAVSKFHRNLYQVRNSWREDWLPPASNGILQVNQLVGKAFSVLAQGTPYEHVLHARTWEQVCQRCAPGDDLSGLSIREQASRVFRRIEQHFVQSLAKDHPKEDFLERDLRGFVSRSGSGRVLIFTWLTDHVRFLAQRISAYGLGTSALPFTGKSHMRSAEAANNLRRLRSGEDRIGVFTSVGQHGLHIHDTDLVINYTPPTTETELVQRHGRVTPIEGAGYVISYIAEDTQDQGQIRAATQKVRSMDRRLAQHGDLLPFTGSREEFPANRYE